MNQGFPEEAGMKPPRDEFIFPNEALGFFKDRFLYIQLINGLQGG